MNDHHLRCQTTAQRAPPAEIQPPQEDQGPDGPNEENHDAPATALQDEQIRLLGEVVTMIDQTITQDARHNHVVQRTMAQTMRDQHEAHQRQLQQIATNQQQLHQQFQARQQASWAV